MALHPIGSDKLLEIHTGSVNFVIKSKSYASPFVVQDDASSLVISGNDVVSVRIRGQEAIDNGSFFASSYRFNVAPMFFEQHDYEIIVQSTEKQNVSVWHENYSIRDRIDSVTDSGDLVSGIINFGNSIGYSDFEVTVDGKTALTVRIEVYPSKITYKDDYRSMLADITDEIYTVAFDFLKKTYQQMTVGNDSETAPAVFYRILEAIFTSFMRATRKIIETPHHKLVSESVILPYYKVGKTNRATVKWIIKHPEYTVKASDGSIRMSKALAVRKQITYDTTENRFAKYILKSTVKRLLDFNVRYSKSGNCDSKVLRCCDEMTDAIDGIMSASFFREIGEYRDTHSMSLVFEMAPGYRELFKYYLMLKRGLEINGDVFRISMKDTALLYEYWCFIKLVGMMKKNYKLASSDIIKIDNSGITVTLIKGKKSEVRFVNPRTGEKFYLAYNPGEQNTQTVSQKPDNVLTLEKAGERIRYQYIFDAKYRIETELDKFYPDKNPGPKLDDINTMHRYRDSIVYENASARRFIFEKTMFGAYVLFPYADEELYKEHRFYKSIETVNIGGLPFLPGATSLVESFLSELIADSPESAFERATLPVGIEKKLSQVDWTVRDVLVGSVRNEAQYRHCLEKRYYYVPAEFISDKVLPIHYVAMALPKSSSNPGIRYYGTVIRVSKVKRSSIPFPSSKNNPNKDYYAFVVKEWTELPHPILPRDDSVYEPKFTNMFLLEHSDETYELFNIHNEEEYRLLAELKRMFSAGTAVTQKDNEALFHFGDKCSVWSHNGTLDLIDTDGTILGSFPISEFRRSPKRVLKEIGEKAKYSSS